MEPMNICVVGGTGYVGLVTGLGFAEIGNNVINVDIDSERIRMLQSGKSPIHEEGILPVLRRNLDAGRIQFSSDLSGAVASSQVIFIAVGTPSREDGQADLSQVIQVAEDLSRYVKSYKVIVIKSTVPVGTVELVRGMLCREKVEGEDFDIVANPEFLREGKGLYDFFYPDRIVIGVRSEKARSIMTKLYRPIVKGNVAGVNGWSKPQTGFPVPVVETDFASAQMIKYASNTFLATRISFINEIAELCEKVNADIKEVCRGMGYDPRISHTYLEAGLGFGGPCLEKDLSALLKIAEGNGYQPQLLKAVLERNHRQIAGVITKLKDLVGYLLYKKIVTIYGLSFKSETNDVRNSLSLKVIDRLEKEGAIIRAYDPLSIEEARILKPNLEYCEDPYEAARHADALLILTDWACFRDLDYSQIKLRMASPRIVDARNLLDVNSLKELGFTYTGIGRR